jgi:PPOX class probable F420-dependent enzyme
MKLRCAAAIRIRRDGRLRSEKAGRVIRHRRECSVPGHGCPAPALPGRDPSANARRKAGTAPVGTTAARPLVVTSVNLTRHLPAERREHVEARLHSNLMAWLTTVRPGGQPDSVPVWFLVRDDETILVYSQRKKIKLRNISENPKVTLGLDVTDIGRDIIRIDGTAQLAEDIPPADRQPQYAAKYAERIGAMFGTPRQFAELFSEALIITPSRLHA